MVQALGSNIKVTAEYVWGVVSGHMVVCGVIHPCHMWSMPHTKVMKWWDNISIPALSSLDHYTTDKVHGSRNSLLQYSG